MAAYVLPFEKPLLELQNRIDELRRVARENGIDAPQDAARLETEDYDAGLVANAGKAIITAENFILKLCR